MEGIAEDDQRITNEQVRNMLGQQLVDALTRQHATSNFRFEESMVLTLTMVDAPLVYTVIDRERDVVIFRSVPKVFREIGIHAVISRFRDSMLAFLQWLNNDQMKRVSS